MRKVLYSIHESFTFLIDFSKCAYNKENVCLVALTYTENNFLKTSLTAVPPNFWFGLTCNESENRPVSSPATACPQYIDFMTIKTGKYTFA